MKKKQAEHKIEYVETARLVPYARNAKKHPQEQIALIAGSIREFGFCAPVLIDEENGIIAGHGRVLAAQKLGMEKVPCVRLSHLTETQKRAYILADNRLSEAGGSGWDYEMLSLELQDLEKLDVDLELIGFADFAPVPDELPSGAREVGAADLATKHVCPRCKYEF